MELDLNREITRISDVDKLMGLPGRSKGLFKWADILRADPCAYCGKKKKGKTRKGVKKPGMTVDHIVSRSEHGYEKGWYNQTGCCYDCNHNGKQDTPLLIFLLKKRNQESQVN